MTSSKRAILLCIPIWIAMLYFATVHELAIIITTVITAICSISLLLENHKKPPWIIAGCGLFLLAFLLLQSIPLPIQLHTLLRSSAYELMLPGLAESSTTWQPFALRPRQQLLWFAFITTSLLYSWACASQNKLHQQLHLIMAAGVALCLLAWTQRISGAQHIYWMSQVPTFSREAFFGSFVNPNHAGAFLAGLLPLALLLRKPFRLSCFGIIAGGLLTTQSRGAILAGILGMAVYLAITEKKSIKWLYLGLLLSALLAALRLDFLPTANSEVSLQQVQTWSSSRLQIWSDSIHILPSFSWFGVGKDGFVDAYAMVKEHPTFSLTHHAHQEILELFIQLGVFMGPMAIFVWFWLLWTGWKNTRQANDPVDQQIQTAFFCGALAMSLAGCLDFPFQVGANVMLFGFLVAGMLQPSMKTQSAASTKYAPWILQAIAILSILFLIWQHNQPNSPYANHRTWLQKGETLRRQKQHQEALVALRTAIRAAPLNSRAVRQYALTLRHIDLTASLPFAHAATQLAPSNVLTWMTLAELQALQGDIKASWGSWQQCLALDFPDNDNAERYVKQALLTGKAPAIAISHILPKRFDRHRTAAWLLAKMGKQQVAEQVLQRILPQDPIAALSLAELLLRDKRPTEAWQVVQKHPPKDCKSAHLQARILASLDRAELAKKRYRIAIAHCGNSAKLQRSLLLVRLRMGESKAIPAAQKALKNNPQDFALRRLLIHALLRDKQRKQAIVHAAFLQEANRLNNRERQDIELLHKGLRAKYLMLPAAKP